MILDPAFGIRSTVARVLANAVDASLLRGAVGIADTLSHLGDGRRGLASSATAADVTSGTHADHGAHRDRTHHLTIGGSLTRVQNRTRVLTLVLQAGQPRGALRILFAFGSRFGPASHVRVAHHSGRASTQRQMVLHLALGTRPAVVSVHARVDALRVDA